MRRALSVLATVVGVFALAGCWPVPGGSADRRAHNAVETRITQETVGTLTEAWTAPVAALPSDPVITPAGIYVAGYTGGVANLMVTAVHRDGTPKWEAPFCCEAYRLVDVHAVGDRIAVGWYNDISEGSGTSWFSGATGAPAAGVGTPGILQAVRGARFVLVDFTLNGFPRVSFRNTDAPAENWDGGILHSGRPATFTVGTARAYHAMHQEARAYPLSGGRSDCGSAENPEACPIWARALDGTGTPPVIGIEEATVFVGTSAGTVYALDAATGAVQWSAAVGAAVHHPPALAHGRLFVPTAGGDLVVLDAAGCGAATCAALWSAPTGSPLSAQPAVAGDVVVTGSDDGGVHAFPTDGCAASPCAPLWSATTGSQITGAPAIGFGQVVVGTADGRLIAYAPDPG